MAIDDSAIAVGALIEIENGGHAQVRQVVRQLVEMLTSQYVFALFGIRTAGHQRGILSYSLFVRYEENTVYLCARPATRNHTCPLEGEKCFGTRMSGATIGHGSLFK